MNYNIKREWPLLIILVIPFIVGAILYPHLPEQIRFIGMYTARWMAMDQS